MKGIEKLAALPSQHISERRALSVAEGFTYSQYLLRPFQYLLRNNTLDSMKAK